MRVRGNPTIFDKKKWNNDFYVNKFYNLLLMCLKLTVKIFKQYMRIITIQNIIIFLR